MFIGFLIFALIVFAILLASILTNPPNLTLTNQSFVTFAQLGRLGRLGNQLFQIASTTGFAQEEKLPIILPKWNYQDNFRLHEKLTFSEDYDLANIPEIRESNPFQFEFQRLNKQSNLHGCRQHPGYFSNVVPEVRDMFTFAPELLAPIQRKIPDNTIGVHVRRGDYVNNPTHQVCTLEYYQNGISFFKHRSPQSPVFIISDDPEWCKIKFPNCDILDTSSEMGDFVALSLCKFKIISNSTFAWWAAWLDARYNSEVLLPTPWIHGFDGYEHLYNPDWHIYDIKTNKITESLQRHDVTIGGYYQCFKQPKAFLQSVQSFRRVYPTSTLVIVNDDGDQFQHAASRFNAIYSRNKTRGGNNTTTCLTSNENAVLFVTNFINGAKQIKEVYFCLLEDDTNIQRAIQINPEDTRFAIIGNNQGDKSPPFPEKIQHYLGVETGYGGSGGSLFLTAFWANLDIQIITQQIKVFGELNDSKYYSDMMLSFLCILNHGLIIRSQDIYPTEISELRAPFGSKNYPAILHLYKDLYNKPLDNLDKYLLQPKGDYLRIAIIGPGSMSIPPVGWGAIEILIWNYAKEMEHLGHQVMIINETNPIDIINQTKKCKPHFVHIQFDEFAYLASEISEYIPIVGISLHFAYLEQPLRWGHYSAMRVIKEMKNSNIFQFALSPTIAKLYETENIQRVILANNGADSDLFRFSDIPKFPNRTICVGKIDPRKRQSFLQSNPEIWFAGNEFDSQFDYSSTRYLGEWNKQTLYTELTEYANLVLLSDGEADPLVIKEALVAGLGIVTNRVSSANLDLSQSFITIIPDDKLEDRTFIDKAISENRKIAIQQRTNIREYSHQFWWNQLVPRYLENVKHIRKATIAQSGVTIVSCYFRIPSKQPFSFYTNYVYAFLSNVRQHCVFYTSEDLLYQLQGHANSNVEFRVHDRKNDEFSHEFWVTQCNRDVEKYHTPELANLWNLKKWYILETAKSFPQNSINHNYIWCDAGCIRTPILATSLQNLGTRYKLNDNKLHFNALPFPNDNSEIIDKQVYFKYPATKISAAVIFGNVSSWQNVSDLYNKVARDYNDHEIAATSDQYMFMSCELRKPELFQFHIPQTNDQEEWFRFVEII